jgi:hypothetical protein
MPVPTWRVAKVAATPVVSSVTSSPETTTGRPAAPKSSVAAFVPS